MRPNPIEPFGTQSDTQPPATSSSTTRVSASTRPIRSSEGRQPPSPNFRSNILTLTDSWIEISSHPSSSSLSSTLNDIVTTGLHVRSDTERLSRQFRSSAHSIPQEPRAISAAGSSQDEYEESGSESDHVLSSSNEDITQQDDENADDDDTSTALGVGSLNPVFTPQPHAFSQPVSSSSHDRPNLDSYFPPVSSSARSRDQGRHSDRTITQRSYQRQSQTRTRSDMSSYQPDHDAALRASLTTLLSCAAAVRPKTSQEPRAGVSSQPTRPATNQPAVLRLVPESELNSPSQRNTAIKATSSPKQVKRKSRESSKDRQAKKSRAAASRAAALSQDEFISPTLASWMISAGVVLVFSAISFSAGYAWGREVGRIEGEMGITSGSISGANGLGGTSSCGQETLRSTSSGLRRLRWGAGSSSVRA
ncbi:hypothetical protein B0A52_05972 [Exophiala mesophila]|uniref:REJ domain-containing protein n=1 Tax=Exophiala mesophila TaxID=212818 RepID=A0A438N413_EXOME|nr:hypothetical protein B0A52_05972 [Exophiala mesophila]